MDDDWGLHAVVKSCSSYSSATTNNNNKTNNEQQNPIPSFPSMMNFQDDQYNSSYNNNYNLSFDNDINNHDPFEGLQDIYQEFCGADLPLLPSVAPAAAHDQVFQHHEQENHVMHVQPSLGMMNNIPSFEMMNNNMQIQPSFEMMNNVQIQPSFEMMNTMQMQPSFEMMNNNMQMQQLRSCNSMIGTSSSSSLPSTFQVPMMMNSQPSTRPRRSSKKSQHPKIIREMTQEQLSADSWAWRKYGQKPIKGSPYPRNYYRCSTSKGCAARKQVERSSNDPGVFIVSYCGEHTHPRPSNRSSLSGTTRSKLSTNTTRNINNINNNNFLLRKGSFISSSSSLSGSSFSPSTPLVEGEATAQNDVEMVEVQEKYENTNMINVPNYDAVDMFKGFQGSDDIHHDYSSGGNGGDLFSDGLLSSPPPWTATSFVANGGGNCG